MKYKKEQQIEIAKDEEVLRASMGQLKKAKETNVSKVMDLRALPKVPRDPRMMANNGGVPIGKKTGFKREGPSSLIWGGGSKTKLTNGQSVLTRARREAKEISQMSKLSRPTHALAAQAGQVRKAPAGMVNEYKKASGSPVRILSRKKPLDRSPGAASVISLEEREARLSAMQSGFGQTKNTATANETLVGSSDEDESDNDAKFNEKPKQLSRTGSSSSPHRSTPSPYTSTISKRPIATSSSSSRPSSYQLNRSVSLLPLVGKSANYGASGTSVPKPHPGATDSPTNPPRGTSPSHGAGERRQPPVIARKRAEVDIFNRGPSKKPRTR